MSFAEQYSEARGMRYWPCESLVRFVGENYVLTALNGTNPQSVLEVGCGNGANLWFLARYFSQTHGLDLEPAALEHAERLLGQVRAHAELTNGSVLKMDAFGNDEFDLVVDVTCLQHTTFAQHAIAFAEIARVLKRGGRFFSYHLGNGTVGYQRIFPDCGPVALPESKWLRRTLGKAGFASTITSVSRTYDESEGGAMAQYWVVDATMGGA